MTFDLVSSGASDSPEGVKVCVTPLLGAKTDTFRPKKLTAPVISANGSEGIFCDWISIYQHHSEGLPNINDGAVMRYDTHGTLECLTLKKARIEGSHDSSVYIRCDGTTVWFEGNVSKFGRPDNVFGFTFEECIQRINALLKTLNLPPFTAGKGSHRQMDHGQWEKVYTGARVTRIDVTQNFSAGSKSAAADFMRWLSSQQASRLKTGTYGEGDTVDFGRGSKLVYTKAYLKGVELLRHCKKRVDPERPGQRMYDPYTEELAAWCDAAGLVRWETTYKSMWLNHHNQQYLGAINMNVFHTDFAKRKEVFTRANIDQDELTDLPPKLLGVYRMWVSGDDLASKFQRRTFYRHRKALIPYGVDIAVRSNVRQFQPRTRVITLGPVTPPDFYQLPQLHQLGLAA
nr:phage/plasmid replication protein, II/X family [uncultured Rhodoferax sp.]